MKSNQSQMDVETEKKELLLKPPILLEAIQMKRNFNGMYVVPTSSHFDISKIIGKRPQSPGVSTLNYFYKDV